MLIAPFRHYDLCLGLSYEFAKPLIDFLSFLHTSYTFDECCRPLFFAGAHRPG